MGKKMNFREEQVRLHAKLDKSSSCYQKMTWKKFAEVLNFAVPAGKGSNKVLYICQS